VHVEQIKTDKTKPFILKKHYARRMPSISYAFGLFTDEGMIGVVTFGSPASPPLVVGVCGEEYKKYVIELNRLVVNKDAPVNSASFLVSNAIKKIGDKIVSGYKLHLHRGIKRKNRYGCRRRETCKTS